MSLVSPFFLEHGVVLWKQLLVILFTLPMEAIAKYCDTKCVCVSVCLSIFLQGYLWKQVHDLSQIFVHVAYGHGSVLLQRSCNMLCTSGFVDDIMFFLQHSAI